MLEALAVQALLMVDRERKRREVEDDERSPREPYGPSSGGREVLRSASQRCSRQHGQTCNQQDPKCQQLWRHEDVGLAGDEEAWDDDTTEQQQEGHGS